MLKEVGKTSDCASFVPLGNAVSVSTYGKQRKRPSLGFVKRGIFLSNDFAIRKVIDGILCPFRIFVWGRIQSSAFQDNMGVNIYSEGVEAGRSNWQC